MYIYVYLDNNQRIGNVVCGGGGEVFMSVFVTYTGSGGFPFCLHGDVNNFFKHDRIKTTTTKT